MKTLTKSIYLTVFASLAFNAASARSQAEILASIVEKKDAKPFLFFESYGKFPHAIINYPIKNEVRDILFACNTKGTDFVATPNDFANLIPAKFRKSWPLLSIYQEHKYSGFFADKLVLGTVCANDYQEQFKKPFMVNEYQSGMAMKWVFENAAQFQNFEKYFLKNISEPAATKPLLVLEIEKDSEALTDEDLDFLDKFFDVADLGNPEVKSVVDAYVSNLNQAVKDASDYATIQVGKGFNNMIVDMLDKEFDGFEGKKMAVKALKWGVGIVAVVAVAKIVDAYMDAGPWKLFNKLLPNKPDSASERWAKHQIAAYNREHDVKIN